MVNFFVLIMLLSGCLAGTQIFIKIGLNKISDLSISISLIGEIFSNIFFWLAGTQVVVASILWFYILSKYELSLAYPVLISISYIFVVLASVIIFKENISLVRWAGVLTIVLGIFLVTR